MRTYILPLVFLGSALGVLGCSKNSVAPARVSGSISYKGQPIKAGTLQFHTQGGVAYDGQISSDGTYTATDLPEGEMVVTVDTEAFNPAAKGAVTKESERRAKSMAGREPPAGMPGELKGEGVYVKIPEKYKNAKTSTVTVTLSRGRQVKNIELTD